MAHEDVEDTTSTILSCNTCTKPCVLRETLDSLHDGLITAEQAITGGRSMHDTKVILKDGTELEAPIWEWRPTEGYFTLVDHEGPIYLRDVESAVTTGARSNAGPFNRDELERARENGWDGT